MTASMMPQAELDDSDYTDNCDDSSSATSEEPIYLSESETDYSGKLIICLYILVQLHTSTIKFLYLGTDPTCM